MKITTKAQFYDLWHRDLLGNRPQAYGYLGAPTNLPETPILLGLREHVPGGQFRLCMSDNLPAPGPHPVSLSEVLDPNWQVFSCEATHLPGGWHIRYSQEKKLFRDAMRGAVVANGLKALHLLRTYLGDQFQQLESFEEQYPDAIYEFTTYSKRVGVQQESVIWWEVRHY